MHLKVQTLLSIYQTINAQLRNKTEIAIASNSLDKTHSCHSAGREFFNSRDSSRFTVM